VFLAALGGWASAPELRADLVATAPTVLAGHWRRRSGHEIIKLDDDDVLAPVPGQTALSWDAAVRAAVILGGASRGPPADPAVAVSGFPFCAQGHRRTGRECGLCDEVAASGVAAGRAAAAGD
jgi:hypothetical protein